MQTTGDKQAVSFAFYTGQGSQEPLINRITSFFSGKYMHCEMVFSEPNGRGQNLACGVWQGETVFFRHKTFGKDCWEWRSISLPAADIQRLKDFCYRQSKSKKPFNKSGLYRCTTPFPRQTDGKQWFCSELCVAALQSIGLFPNEMPGSITPSNLYELLGQLDSYANGSPLVDQRIATKSLRFNTERLATSRFFESK